MDRVFVWRAAMTDALYGAAGYFSAGAGSAGFRTSANASPLFADALLRLVGSVDAALGEPEPFTVVDVGGGRGEVLSRFAAAATPGLARRLRLTVVELAPRPPGLDPAIGWADRLPPAFTGVLLATEWLDNVPLDIAEADGRGRLSVVQVDPRTGSEAAGGALSPADEAWVRRWWPGPWAPGTRVELGRPRDEAWAAAVRTVHKGLALTVDYGHTRDSRPPFGTLTGYAGGRQVPPVPDGTTDLTAHVAFDAVRAAGEAVAGEPARLTTQREALAALGVHGTRPPQALATSDPTGYLRALAGAAAAGELTDPAGLGAHRWLLQPVAAPVPLAGMRRWADERA